MAARSRWLVGSSSSSTSGSAASACASATRFFQPPDSEPISASAGSPSRDSTVSMRWPSAQPSDRVERRVQRVDPFEPPRIVVAVGQQRRRVVIVGEHPSLGAESQRDRVVDGARGVERGLLRDEGDADVRRDPELAVVEVDAAGEHPEQRRLARAVAADEADALARIELELGVVEQRMVAEREAGAA